jgi:hypothetical protein
LLTLKGCEGIKQKVPISKKSINRPTNQTSSLIQMDLGGYMELDNGAHHPIAEQQHNNNETHAPGRTNKDNAITADART